MGVVSTRSVIQKHASISRGLPRAPLEHPKASIDRFDRSVRRKTDRPQQLTLVLPERPVDGVAYFEEVIVLRIRAAVARGERCGVVFDIDNTLADSRQRTLRAAQIFGRAHGIAALENVALEKVGCDGRHTLARLGLSSAALATKFQRFWESFFWDPNNFALDTRIDRIAKLAERAAEEGAEVFYLTGRVEMLREKTRVQLQGLELPNADDAHLLMKPRLGTRTDRFKAKILRQKLGAHPPVKVLGFVSEGRRDIGHIQRNTRVPALFYDFPIDREAAPLDKRTPIISAQISRE